MTTRARTRPAARQGFSLLEVSMAIALALLLVVAMVAFYKQTADLRTAIGAEADVIGAERTVMDRATSELRCAVTYDLAGLTFQGTASDMKFATTVLPGADSWVVPAATDGGAVPPGSDRLVVGYRLGTTLDEAGKPVVTGIERTTQRLATARTVEEGKEIEVKLLAPAMKFMHLSYWDGSAWLDTWTGQGLPAAVEIVLGEQPLPEGVEPDQYPYTIFRRVVFVPAGAKPVSGTIIRGLDEGSTP
jgi:prepilin-type N-terminal cleavage/methylation domain-containing protein